MEDGGGGWDSSYTSFKEQGRYGVEFCAAGRISMDWRHSIDRNSFFGGSMEIYSTLVLVSNVQGFGGKSMLNWGQVDRLWPGGDIILVWRNVISLFMFLLLSSA